MPAIMPTAHAAPPSKVEKLTRRKLLSTAPLLIAMPAIVRAASLMAIKPETRVHVETLHVELVEDGDLSYIIWRGERIPFHTIYET